tara:strand:+ start:620 stop:3406 length:2787 start_codon:yes stop_codon:yes gene_type:complete
LTELSSSAGFDAQANALPKTYDPAGTEHRWQRVWEKHAAFHPDPSHSGEAFAIVIPPPNVTGSLHMGHAFNTVLIDSIVRYQRMLGKNVLCLPGTDHASIAVQTILEKQLKKEGLKKEDIGRDVFLERAWSWKSESGGQIVSQMRRLGFSVDWQRERFTLDKGLSNAVIEAFVRFYEQGLIYRGEYLVNWCPSSCSAVSDLEVEMKEVDGHLWYFRYPFTHDQNLFLEVATTRPETMLGDVAVAVNPNDNRYKHLVGKSLTLPILGRQILVIADNHVDQNFGTGCVKVTPAHDPNDFAIGKRHNLPQITVMNKTGIMNDQAGPFEGLDRFKAREAVIQTLEKEGYLTKIEKYKHTVPYSDRGKVPVEPLISTQWFVKMSSLASKTQNHLDNGEPKFIPSRWGKVYQDWLQDIRDWCISRQLWWGHRIPAWFVISETSGKVIESTPFIVARNVDEALSQARIKYGKDVILEQDQDVLDTWFSSGLWPFSTLGWPDKNSKDFNKWYPTNTLVTGFDIIFFWVARMTMMATAFTNQIPFKDVYIHGLVRDEQNRKMSKSLGNGIDPLLLIDRYGTDALRFALVREVAGAGQDIRLDYNRKNQTSVTVEAARNFGNKLWNATRFALINFGDFTFLDHKLEIDKSLMELSDLWILSRLSKVNRETSFLYSKYGLGEAAKGLYEFAWHDFCDWYLELIKTRLNLQENANKEQELSKIIAQKILLKVLSDLFIMLHPLMPHLTEELWHAINRYSEDKLLTKQSWPDFEADNVNESLEESFSELFDSIRVVRNLRAVAGLKPSQKAKVCFVTNRSTLQDILNKSIPEIKTLTRTNFVEVLTIDQSKVNENCKHLAAVIGDLQVILPIEGLVDIEALRNRLLKDIAKADKEITNLSERLSNTAFSEKAPPEVVAECKSKLKEAQSQADLARERLSNL